MVTVISGRIGSSSSPRKSIKPSTCGSNPSFLGIFGFFLAFSGVSWDAFGIFKCELNT